VVRAGYEKEYGQPAVNYRLSKLEDLQNLIKIQQDRGKSASDIAKENKINELLVWSLILDRKSYGSALSYLAGPIIRMQGHADLIYGTLNRETLAW